MIRLVYLFVILIFSFKIYAKEHTGLTYSRYEKDKHVIHVLNIDPKNFQLKLVKAHNQVIGRETVDAIARRTNMQLLLLMPDSLRLQVAMTVDLALP
ncbi:MAG: hypothetical protein LN590_05730 [Rickettsia endosymbiont of Glossina mortisans submortisans]|nr:hypothetical protein [Rickettsia endosymbiont of Glossina mortisans submortisans]